MRERGGGGAAGRAGEMGGGMEREGWRERNREEASERETGEGEVGEREGGERERERERETETERKGGSVSEKMCLWSAISGSGKPPGAAN